MASLIDYIIDYILVMKIMSKFNMNEYILFVIYVTNIFLSLDTIKCLLESALHAIWLLENNITLNIFMSHCDLFKSIYWK